MGTPHHYIAFCQGVMAAAVLWMLRALLLGTVTESIQTSDSSTPVHDLDAGSTVVTQPAL